MGKAYSYGGQRYRKQNIFNVVATYIPLIIHRSGIYDPCQMSQKAEHGVFLLQQILFAIKMMFSNILPQELPQFVLK